jgi:hypothetical protein
VQPVVTSSASPPAMHSQIFIPLGSDFDTMKVTITKVVLVLIRQ